MIELDDKFAPAFNNRGIVFENMKKRNLALADYTRAIELDPSYTDAFKNRGILYHADRKMDLALAGMQSFLRFTLARLFSFIRSTNERLQQSHSNHAELRVGVHQSREFVRRHENVRQGD